MRPIRALSVASEVYPIIKTGGLADVVGALPTALNAEGLEVRTVVPGFPGVMQASQKDGMQTMDMALVDLATRGLVTKAEAQSRSMNPNLFAAAVGGAA